MVSAKGAHRFEQLDIKQAKVRTRTLVEPGSPKTISSYDAYFRGHYALQCRVSCWRFPPPPTASRLAI